MRNCHKHRSGGDNKAQTTQLEDIISSPVHHIKLDVFYPLGVHIICVPHTVVDSFNAAGSSSSTLFPSQQFIL
eukprot:scaffold10364_cov155-Skeletonema_dohrnii-CCMP3373.AAC.6